MASELLPTSADMLGIDIPKVLPSSREIVKSSNGFLSREMVDRVRPKKRRWCELMKIFCLMGLRAA